MCFTYVGEICKAYERSYILGVHDAILHDTPLLQSCADKALRLIDKPRLLDVHIKKVPYFLFYILFIASNKSTHPIIRPSYRYSRPYR